MPTQPNILIFMSDQQQGDTLDPAHPCQTMYSDRLAQDGLRFAQAYCPTAHCSPSRATFFTGQYPSRHGVFNNVSNPAAISRGIPRNLPTFAEALQAAGYRTLFAGKWHISAEENPKDRGWEELLVTAGTDAKMHVFSDQWRAGAYDSDERPYGSIKRPGWGDYRVFSSYQSQAPDGYSDHEDHAVTEVAKQALMELASGDQPWVLFVGTFGTHDPFIVPEQFLERYPLESIPLPANYHDTLVDKPGIYRRMRQQHWRQLTETEIRDAVRHYWAYCTLIDALFGDLLTTLDATGQSANTLVIRLSDHGEYMGAHGLFFKGVPAFREAHHIPLIMRLPNTIAQPGRVVDQFVNLADIYPTLLELAGASVPKGLTGRSLMPFLRGETPSNWRDAHYTQFNGVELYYSQRSVTTATHKYVYNGFDFDELYDLEADPLELVNRADDPAYDAIKHDLVRRMWRFAAEEGDERIFNPYGTVAFAPWGPADALKQEGKSH